jgi:hypothetical protein
VTCGSVLGIGLAVVVAPVPVSCAPTESDNATPIAPAMTLVVLLRSIIGVSSPDLFLDDCRGCNAIGACDKRRYSVFQSKLQSKPFVRRNIPVRSEWRTGESVG